MGRDVRRRLEQYAANPRCEANVRAAVGAIPMESVARFLGIEPAMGQSPFALFRGQQFERGLFDDEAARLRRELMKCKALPANAAGFVDLRLRRQGGTMDSFEAALGAFRKLLRDAAKSTGDARMALPTIVAGAAIPAPGDTFDGGVLALDVLTLHPAPRPGAITLRVGEVKVYPDRGGFTDGLELASARAQAGLYVYALEEEVRALGLTRDLLVADDGFLVLTRPGSNQPSVRAGEDLRHQAERARGMFEQVRRMAGVLPARDGEPTEGDLRAVAEAPKRYGDACLGFCELADRCQREALAEGLPQALGEDLARALGTLSLHRALALLHGDAATNDAERDFLRRVR